MRGWFCAPWTAALWQGQTARRLHASALPKWIWVTSQQSTVFADERCKDAVNLQRARRIAYSHRIPARAMRFKTIQGHFELLCSSHRAVRELKLIRQKRTFVSFWTVSLVREACCFSSFRTDCAQSGGKLLYRLFGLPVAEREVILVLNFCAQRVKPEDCSFMSWPTWKQFAM